MKLEIMNIDMVFYTFHILMNVFILQLKKKRIDTRGKTEIGS